MASSIGSGKTWLIIGGVIAAMLLVCCGVGGWFANSFYQQSLGSAELPDGMTYTQWRDGFQTQLLTPGPAPQDYDDEPLPPGVEQVSYPSGDLSLKAWVMRPQQTATGAEPGSPPKRPGLVFLHGGFAFGIGDLLACQEASDRGYVVMAPALRGENGNPGNFEMFLGEADDAKAAATWLASQPDVAPNRVYVFGHSVGGGVSAMLSLLDQVPIRHSGSSGGLYPPVVFLGWASDVPFNNTPEERMARLLLGNISHMQRDHYAYLGEQDNLRDSIAIAESEAPGESNLHLEIVPGDHFTSFDAALSKYLDLADQDE
ncbi:Alpha/beta hydrolase family protein [Rubripirellula lacrimiformis]|uniref:Alpha/beta hydrolase family protein n=1 Tax=Rubripirellula lacrimiformis TaxID=1930273 RepID=A0A517N9C2_9BACT|nr:alpha/beta fold hydrolase [Rubripirellula lacrimiformis]QDT03740.1 Alpha/beta hydrolase family protein [Rubripirellula lacrimiformis]